jgi:hypothetical protein
MVPKYVEKLIHKKTLIAPSRIVPMLPAAVRKARRIGSGSILPSVFIETWTKPTRRHYEGTNFTGCDFPKGRGIKLRHLIDSRPQPDAGNLFANYCSKVIACGVPLPASPEDQYLHRAGWPETRYQKRASR